MHNFGRFNAAILSGVALLCGVAGAGAQPAPVYPNKPLRMIVPFPAAGGADIFARLVSRKLADQFGQGVVVDNRAGASGIIGSEAVAKAPADGYTLLLGTTGTHSTNPVVGSEEHTSELQSH